jgi:hypothetical protein
MMNVVSLFNGIGVGHLALTRLGVPLGDYYTAEIDPHANIVSRRWNPASVSLGDVRTLTEQDFSGGKGCIDLVMGGSPCQSFSIAGKGREFDDPRGNLVVQFFRIVKLLKPRFFLLENVVMSDHSARMVSHLAGVKPVTLDSEMWCAQQRVRMYWTNIPLPELPTPCTDVLGDVVRLPILSQRERRPVRVGIVNKGGQGDRIYATHGKGVTLSAYSGGTAGPANMLVGDG